MCAQVTTVVKNNYRFFCGFFIKCLVFSSYALLKGILTQKLGVREGKIRCPSDKTTHALSHHVYIGAQRKSELASDDNIVGTEGKLKLLLN